MKRCLFCVVIIFFSSQDIDPGISNLWICCRQLYWTVKVYWTVHFCCFNEISSKQNNSKTTPNNTGDLFLKYSVLNIKTNRSFIKSLFVRSVFEVHSAINKRFWTVWLRVWNNTFVKTPWHLTMKPVEGVVDSADQLLDDS